MQTGRMRPHMRPGMMRGGPNSRQAGPGSFRGNGSMQYGQNRGPGGFHGGPGGGFGPGRGGMGPGMGAGFHIGPGGMWWKNPMVVQRLTLTPDQVTRMDAIFQKSRIDLIDLKANLEKQEVTLEPMLSANPPDTPKASLQIDKVADARASLEKANAKMLLSIRGVLTPDQWTKLSAHEGSGRFAGPGAASPGTAAAPAPPTTGSGPAPATPPRRQRGLHPPAPTQTTPPPS
jgi:Spy/CpxP family protein refolding chaperone